MESKDTETPQTEIQDMHLFPPRHRANLLTDLDEVKFCTRFEIPVFCKQFGIHDNTKLHRHEYSR